MDMLPPARKPCACGVHFVGLHPFRIIEGSALNLSAIAVVKVVHIADFTGQSECHSGVNPRQNAFKEMPSQGKLSPLIRRGNYDFSCVLSSRSPRSDSVQGPHMVDRCQR